MSLWRQFTRGLHVLTRRRAADQDVSDEVEHYLDQAAAEWTAKGLSPDEARRAARAELGSIAAVREEVRDYGWENGINTLAADLRYGARRLRSRPAFAVVATLTLGLGIGASTAIFSAVNPVLFEPLPYPDARRVMMIWDTGDDGVRADVTFGTYRELLERNHSFDAIAVARPWQPTVTGGTEPERLDGQRVSAEYFRVLGVVPVRGRDFDRSDDQLNGPKVAIINDGLWRRRFGADEAIVGRQMALNDVGYTVIGVMPEAFENVLAPSADVWTTLQYDVALPLDGREWGHHLRMVGRLRVGVPVHEARRDLDTIARAPVAEFPRPRWASLRDGLIANSLQHEITRSIKPALMAIGGAVLLLLAIACVNVTNLLLARGAERRREFAMRAALGASRARIVRQLLTECMLLAIIGGALGMILATAGVHALAALSPPGLPRVNAIGVDGIVFAFALGLTTLVGVIVGLIPAVHASHRDPQSVLQQSSLLIAAGHRRTRRALVVIEVALALVLLVGAGLLLRSLHRLFAVPLGFESGNLLTMQVQTAGRRFDEDHATHQFFVEALEAVRRLPGVTRVALTNQLPLTDDYDVYGVHLESSAAQNSDENRSAFRYAVSPGYFETMGIPLLQGRVLDGHDRAGGALAVVVSDSFARRRLRARDPVGQRLRIGRDDGPWFTVVGVVADVKQTSLAIGQLDAVYTTPEQWHFADTARWLVVRASRDAPSLAPSVRNAVWSVDRNQPVLRAATMDERVATSAAERRFALVLFEVFGGVALLLAAIGIYGVLSGSVTERLREIAVRSALGASRASILALVLGQGMTLTAVGLATGLLVAIASTGALTTLLFGVTRLDPLTHLCVVGLLAGVSAVACWIPASRAARIDPAISLRSE